MKNELIAEYMAHKNQPDRPHFENGLGQQIYPSAWRMVGAVVVGLVVFAAAWIMKGIAQ